MHDFCYCKSSRFFFKFKITDSSSFVEDSTILTEEGNSMSKSSAYFIFILRISTKNPNPPRLQSLFSDHTESLVASCFHSDLASIRINTKVKTGNK